MEIEAADSLAEGWRLWQRWHLAIAPDNQIELDALAADAGQYLGYNRLVGRKRAGLVLPEPILSISTQYTQAPLLRSAE